MAVEYTAAERRHRTLELVRDFDRFKRERAELIKSGDYRFFMASRGYDAHSWEIAVAVLKAAGVIT